jgi:hypothetical protein
MSETAPSQGEVHSDVFDSVVNLMSYRLEEVAGVGVPRIRQQFANRGFFHDLPAVHHGHPVGHLGHSSQVVGDENHSASDL